MTTLLRTMTTLLRTMLNSVYHFIIGAIEFFILLFALYGALMFRLQTMPAGQFETLRTYFYAYVEHKHTADMVIDAIRILLGLS